MATQDDWHRITLRIPSELHEKLKEAGKLSSVNAEIITRLEASFDETSSSSPLNALIEDQSDLIKKQAELIERQTAASEQMLEAVSKMFLEAQTKAVPKEGK